MAASVSYSIHPNVSRSNALKIVQYPPASVNVMLVALIFSFTDLTNSEIRTTVNMESTSKPSEISSVLHQKIL